MRKATVVSCLCGAVMTSACGPGGGGPAPLDAPELADVLDAPELVDVRLDEQLRVVSFDPATSLDIEATLMLRYAGTAQRLDERDYVQLTNVRFFEPDGDYATTTPPHVWFEPDTPGLWEGDSKQMLWLARGAPRRARFNIRHIKGSLLRAVDETCGQPWRVVIDVEAYMMESWFEDAELLTWRLESTFEVPCAP